MLLKEMRMITSEAVKRVSTKCDRRLIITNISNIPNTLSSSVLSDENKQIKDILLKEGLQIMFSFSWKRDLR